MPTANRGRAIPYLLLAPAIAVELVVHIVPSVLAIVLSFFRVNEFTIAHWIHAPYAGLANYRAGLSPGSLGADFYSSLARTAVFTVIVVVASWGLGLGAALLLSRPFRGRAFFRAYFVLPFALPAYATGIGWRFMLGRDDGALNRLLVDDLHLVGRRPFWLIGNNALWVTAAVAVWRMWPFAYLVLATALDSVPSELTDASVALGASDGRHVRYVVLPAIRRVSLVVVSLMALWSFNEFTVPYVLFAGNPPPSASLVDPVIFRDAFSTFDIGVADALDVVVIAIIAVVVLGWLRLSTRTVADA